MLKTRADRQGVVIVVVVIFDQWRRRSMTRV
jgi:ribose/xylose/arabinose/galactoside ABC-type transport system permease subunit